MAVKDKVLETLRLRVVGSSLAVDEAEQALASRAEEIIATVVGGVGQRRHVGRALQDRSQRVAGLSAQVKNWLPGVEALDQQQVDPGLEELAGR